MVLSPVTVRGAEAGAGTDVSQAASELASSASSPPPLCPLLPTDVPLETLLHLTLSDMGLTSLPADVAKCVSLTKLDVGRNKLSDFPASLSALGRLEIVFASGCPNMTRIPPVLGRMPSVTRLGLRSNAITTVDADSLPPAVQHLILTDNAITTLDVAACERLTSVRKLMLSHNKLTSLPADGVVHLRALELLRVANNELTAVPPELLALPRLTWLALSGNPLPGMVPPPMRVPAVPADAVEMDKLVALGKGASGTVWPGTWEGQAVAVKEFNAVTSDGRAEEEVALYGAVGTGNPHVAACVAVMDGTAGGPLGVVMQRLPAGLRDLALPPTIVEVIEDRYPEDGTPFSPAFVRMVVNGMADALAFLHGDLHIQHGDVYAHNMLVDDTHVFLLDFGAAFCYGGGGALDGALVERLEVRAFGVLVKELVTRMTGGGGGLRVALMTVAAACVQEDVAARPSFKELREQVGAL